MSTSSSQCHNNPVLVPPCKPPDHVKNLYDVQTYDPKKWVDKWTSMDVVPVGYRKISQTFQLTMQLFQFVTGVIIKWDYVLWRIIDLLVWNGLLIKLRVYSVTPDPVRWSCQGYDPKNGWINGQVWMWFQWGIEKFLRHFS